MDYITHDDADAFFDDLQARKEAGHQTQAKHCPRSRFIGFLDLTARAWVRIGLRGLKCWAVPDEHLHYSEMLRSDEGRQHLFGPSRMKDVVIDGTVYQIRDEPDWVSQ